MKARHFNQRNKKSGQAMMEYIILVALLAIASIPVAKLLGDVFRDRVADSADAMVEGTDYDSHARDWVSETGKDSTKIRRTMGNFSRR